MLTNNANYNMDEALHEIEEKQLILDAKIDSQVVLQLLVKKGIVSREEVAEMRKTVANFPKYKATIEYLESAKQKAKYYQNNPSEHLRDLLKAKMDGTIK